MQMGSKAVKTAIAFAIGAGALSSVTAVQAAVVINPVNISIPANTGGVYVNVISLASSTSAAGLPGWDINPWGSTGLGFFSPTSVAAPSYVMAPGSAVRVGNLPVGTVIDASSSFGSGSGTAANAVQWNLNSTDNYFGFRFINEAGNTLHYGYAQLQIGATISQRSLIALAYESTPNTAITVVPEPGTYALMGLGLAGVALVARRRKQQA